MIILEPIGGLANRMRVIASGIAMSKALNTGLQVIWNENYELNCPFDKLFKPISEFSIVQKAKKYRHVKSSNQIGLFNRLQARLYNLLLNIDYCITGQDFPSLIWPGKLDIYEEGKNHKNIYIQTCHEFGNNTAAFRVFKPVAEIEESISEITKKFTKNVIGIHIRRTDNLPAVTNSPVSLFIVAIKAELEAQSNTVFFLCSDDTMAKNEIIELFGEKIIAVKKEVSRNTVSGMQDAVVDMYCLSKTNKILGSYYSSFPEVAARFHNIELQVLKVK